MAIRIGIIGAGGMASYHVPGFRKAGAEVVALADPNPVAAKRVSEAQGITKCYTDAAEMLAKEKLDAVSVITPNKFHKPLVIQSLKAGKHVFCEKPPALNAKEAMEMAKAAKAAKKILSFDFNNRARPETLALDAYIKDGTVGKINSAQSFWVRRTGIPGFGGWFTTKALSGGGPVIDLLHGIDLALHFMGYPEPEYVLARTFDDFHDNRDFKGPWGFPDKAGGTCDVETAAHGFVTFKNGSVLSLRNSWAEMVKRETMGVTFQGTGAGGALTRIFGVDGDDSTAEDTCELYVQEHGLSVNRTIVVKKDETMGRVQCAADFVSAIAGDATKPIATPDEAVILMRIIDAIYASSAKRAPVKCK